MDFWTPPHFLIFISCHTCSDSVAKLFPVLCLSFLSVLLGAQNGGGQIETKEDKRGQNGTFPDKLGHAPN